MSHGHHAATPLLMAGGPSFAGAVSTARRSRIAIRVRGAIATLQTDLVRQVSLRPFDEELRVERDAALGLGVELHHPALESAFVELRVDRAVERVGEIDAPPV